MVALATVIDLSVTALTVVEFRAELAGTRLWTVKSVGRPTPLPLASIARPSRWWPCHLDTITEHWELPRPTLTY